MPDLAVAVIARRGLDVKIVAYTLGVYRSRFHSRLRERRRPRRQYQRPDDIEVLATIRTLTDDRPTYGYRRIWALRNLARDQAGQTRLSHKRICRLMSQNGLLLQRYTGGRRGLAHDGQTITIRPKLCLTSDGLESACWNGQRVRFAFALVICDDEAMSWIAAIGGISVGMIGDLILESLQRRFTDLVLPHPIEWLSDDSSCDRAHETIMFARSMGLVLCFTLARAPQSKVVAETFVKTFKRDYAFVHYRPDAQSALAQLPRCFEEYNENDPCKVLLLRSPREFIRSFQQPPGACLV